VSAFGQKQVVGSSNLSGPATILTEHDVAVTARAAGRPASGSLRNSHQTDKIECFVRDVILTHQTSSEITGERNENDC